jgi:hypothetical protein
MANIPGATNILPGVVTDVITESRGVAIPGGTRIAAIIGEGSTDETLVSQANGNGRDGLNPAYSSTTGSDGRHFQMSNYPLISNRTTVFKNGVPLIGLESLINSNSFSSKYDYRIDIATGRIELQAAHIVDQGGSFFIPLSTNVGDGYLSNLTLVDVNAPPEIWTIRCVSVQRNAQNQPIASTAKFLAFGSISGSKLDANGNAIIWTANGQSVSNSILSFSITETTVAFREGDAFTVVVDSGVLNANDSLTVNCIPVANLNDPVIVQGMGDVVNRHGFPSVNNSLSLGCQLAFANAASVLVTVQAAPAMPRRQSFILSNSVNSLSVDDDSFIFALPPGVVPDFNSSIHFFVKNNATNIETQILPNKLDYYTLDTSGAPTTNQFIRDDVAAPNGYSFFYTVKQSFEALNTGEDGYSGRDTAFVNKGVFSSSVIFNSSYVGKQLKIINAENVANNGTYTINNVISGKLYVTHDGFDNFEQETSNVAFQIIDPVTNLPVANGSGLDGYVTPLGSPGQVTAYFGSLGDVDFSSIASLYTKKLKITGSAANNGTYDIIAGPTANQITIEKTVVNENNMRYEVLDLADVSNYVVINHNVVPNGHGLRVTLIDTKEASFYDAGWLNAISSLETIECDIVVPLPKQTISVILQNVLAHCKTMSNIRNKKERVMFTGAINGLTPNNVTGLTPAAVENIGVLEGIQGNSITDILAGNVEDLANYSVSNAFGNTFRCVYFYPDQIVVQAGVDNVFVDGFYIAAAAAGYVSADVRIENPLTNKVLSGFTILRNKQFSTFTLEQLSQAGVSTLQPVSGGGRIIWGITTTQSGYPEEQEISIVFIRDRVAKTLRAGFAGFIGNAESADTGAILNTRAVILLNSLVAQGLITNYKDLSVKRDDVDPRQWNITVRVQPTYPVNYIYIKVSLGQL